MTEVKLTLREVNELGGALKQLQNKELSVKTSYWVGRLINDVDSLLKPMQKNIEDLRKKHGKPNEKGTGYSIKPDDSEALEKFKADLDPLMDEVVTIRSFEMEMLEREQVKIAPSAMISLMKVFIPKEDTKKEPDKKTEN